MAAAVKVFAGVALAISAAVAQETDYVPLKDVVAALDSGYEVHMGGIVSVDWRWGCSVAVNRPHRQCRHLVGV